MSRSLPLPRGAAGLQSPAAGAPSRAAPTLGRSAVSIRPVGLGAARDSGEPARGPGAGRAAAFSRAASAGPGLERRAVGMEKEPSAPRSPFPSALQVVQVGSWCAQPGRRWGTGGKR